MANVPETASYDAGIYQLEVTDQVLGGASGIANAQAKGLANRTAYLKALVDALVATAHGQCRLSVVSTTSIRLDPFNGRNLLINGSLQQVPAAGVTATNAGLLASTLYYVYAFMSGAAMTLELSTNGHAQDATTGVEIKSGDATRTLVGMIYTNPSAQFANNSTNMTCVNWFNRRRRVGISSTVTGSTSSASPVELTTSGRVTFITWADEGVDIQIVGSVYNGSAGNNTATTSPGLDGASYGDSTQATTFAANVYAPAVARAVNTISEGKHVASAFGSVSAGTGNWSFGTQVVVNG